MPLLLWELGGGGCLSACSFLCFCFSLYSKRRRTPSADQSGAVSPQAVIRSDVGPPMQQVYYYYIVNNSRPYSSYSDVNHGLLLHRVVRSQKASALEMHVFLQKGNERVMVKRKSRPRWCTQVQSKRFCRRAPRLQSCGSYLAMLPVCRYGSTTRLLYDINSNSNSTVGETRQTPYSVVCVVELHL